MNRVAACAALLIWASLATCPAAEPPPAAPPPALEDECPLVTEETVTITVDSKALVDKQCIKIKKGKTDVVWAGNSDVRLVSIAFKSGSTSPWPEDPYCQSAKCTLEKAKHATKEGDFRYNVVVLNWDGTWAAADPKVIIKP